MTRILHDTLTASLVREQKKTLAAAIALRQEGRTVQCEKICKASQAFRTRTPPRQFQIWSHACRIVHRSNEATTHTLTPHTRALAFHTEPHTKKYYSRRLCSIYLRTPTHRDDCTFHPSQTQTSHEISIDSRERERRGTNRGDKSTALAFPSTIQRDQRSVPLSQVCLSAIFGQAPPT